MLRHDKPPVLEPDEGGAAAGAEPETRPTAVGRCLQDELRETLEWSEDEGSGHDDGSEDGSGTARRAARRRTGLAAAARGGGDGPEDRRDGETRTAAASVATVHEETHTFFFLKNVLLSVFHSRSRVRSTLRRTRRGPSRCSLLGAREALFERARSARPRRGGRRNRVVARVWGATSTGSFGTSQTTTSPHAQPPEPTTHPARTPRGTTPSPLPSSRLTTRARRRPFTTTRACPRPRPPPRGGAASTVTVFPFILLPVVFLVHCCRCGTRADTFDPGSSPMATEAGAGAASKRESPRAAFGRIPATRNGFARRRPLEGEAMLGARSRPGDDADARRGVGDGARA